MEELEHEIKQLIIDSLHLEDVRPSDLKSDAPLFGKGGAGLHRTRSSSPWSSEGSTASAPKPTT
jgi:hypothetical protein